MKLKRNTVLVLLVLVLAFVFSVSLVSAGPCDSTNSATTVPGHCDRDGTVVGHYTSVYAYDAYGNWYWDLGDGRVQGTVSSIDMLDQNTLTKCDYVNNYRADFGDDPFMNTGWIQNHITCGGYDDNGAYNYMVVHRTDSRFREDYASPGWGPDWRYNVQTISGFGNIARPDHHVGE